MFPVEQHISSSGWPAASMPQNALEVTSYTRPSRPRAWWLPGECRVGSPIGRLACMEHESHAHLLSLASGCPTLGLEYATLWVLVLLMSWVLSHPHPLAAQCSQQKPIPSQRGSVWGRGSCQRTLLGSELPSSAGGHLQAQHRVSGDKACSLGVTTVTLVLCQHRGLGVFSSSQQKAKVRAGRLS